MTGHETWSGFGIRVDPKYRHIYEFIIEHRDLFPGFFNYDLEGNIKPKLEVLTEFGFYRSTIQ